MKALFAFLCTFFCLALAQASPIKVSSLHPLLSEMAERVGGKRVKVVNLFPENGSLHAFEPTSAEISRAAGSRLMLACGKGVEPYLADLRDSLPARTRLVELGADIPDVKVPGTDTVDPHWWNNPENMKRASRSLLAALIEIDPEGQSDYSANQKKYAAEMDRLLTVGRLILRKLPQERRVLVTSHAAMCHFCEAFRLTPIAVHGVAMESEGDTASLARLLAELRRNKVPCLFTEINESPRALEVIASQLNARTMPLVMDGICARMGSYDRIITYNVATVLAGLSEKKEAATE